MRLIEECRIGQLLFGFRVSGFAGPGECMSGLLLRGISKRFGTNSVIDHLDLEIATGSFVTLLGPSGCGKTTLLRMIAGLETLDEGDLYIGGKRCNGIPAQRRKIAMVFQSYALFPHMNVRDNILFGMRIKKSEHHEMFDKLNWVLPMLGLRGLEKRLPREISGGQRQRVALARALVLDPDVLLLDEPLSNLDAALRDAAMEELKRIHRRVGKTIVYVTHNQAEAMTMSDRIAILNRGKLEQYHTPRTVYDYPGTTFAAEFIGSPAINLLEGEVVRKESDLGVQTSVGFILLEKERTRELINLVGGRIIVGIRPQNITLQSHVAARRYSDTPVELVVDLVEILGDRSLVVGKSQTGSQLRFLVARDEDVTVESMARVIVDGRKVHVFDAQTKKNLFLK